MKEYVFSIIAVVVFLISLVCDICFFVGGILFLCGIKFPLWMIIAGGIVGVFELGYLLYKG